MDKKGAIDPKDLHRDAAKCDFFDALFLFFAFFSRFGL